MAFLYMLLVKTVDEARMEESADDMQAADIMPMPMMETALGHKYCSARGST
jgi:hypothetical protein